MRPRPGRRVVSAVRYVRRVNADATAAPDAPDTAPGRLVLLTTSHRVAPGLLSWPAWQTLRAADRVLCADDAHPQLPYLREAGIAVERAVPGARELVEFCRDGGRTAAVITSADGDSELTDGLARMAGSGRETMPDLELLPGSYDLPGARLLDVAQVMDQIRRQCPWSGVRTHEDLAKYGIEEMYELVEAIEEGDRKALREELGDVLLQVVFHARIAQDDPDEPFSVDDVAGTLVDKLIRRHPHIFGEEAAHTPRTSRRTGCARKRSRSSAPRSPKASRSASPPWRWPASWPPGPYGRHRCPPGGRASGMSCWLSPCGPRRPARTRRRRCGPLLVLIGMPFGPSRRPLRAPRTERRAACCRGVAAARPSRRRRRRRSPPRPRRTSRPSRPRPIPRR